MSPHIPYWPWQLPNTFGVIIMIGTCLGIWLMAKRGAREGFDKDKMWDFGIYMVLAGIVGARFTEVWENWDSFWQPYADGEISFWQLVVNCIAIWRGGLTYYGGFLFAAPLGVWLLQKWKWNFWQFADIAVPCLALAHGIGRIGCFMQGCCYGVETSSVLGVTFPNDAMAYQGSGSLPPGTPVHPTQLYESAALLLIFVFLSWLYYRRHLRGSLLFIYLMLYGAARFTVEIYRGDNLNHEFFEGVALHLSQYLALAMILIGFVGYYVLWVNRNEKSYVTVAQDAEDVSEKSVPGSD